MKNKNAILERCKEIYTELEGRAVSDGEDLVYEGIVQTIYDEMPYSNSYYVKAQRYLVAMGCVTSLQRGSAHSQSKFVLNYPPTKERFDSTNFNLQPDKDQRIADLLDRIRRLEYRVDQLEERLGE